MLNTALNISKTVVKTCESDFNNKNSCCKSGGRVLNKWLKCHTTKHLLTSILATLKRIIQLGLAASVYEYIIFSGREILVSTSLKSRIV